MPLTNMATRLDISEAEWQIVAETLARYLPGRCVWAFGSRATGRHLKKYSDLDLAVAGELSWADKGRVLDSLDESPVHFKVDLVGLQGLDQDFRRRIERDFVVLQRGTGDEETGDLEPQATAPSS
ncbi:nucleotidyltransferase family protein [Granulicella sibirica]|uniref:Type I restriction-modification system, specificity subunit S n=1 Tax=Granulicella sibirica TaxID=2479048 RepID=A0A4Q0T0Z5_9BACT|nr:nucleotidyltransferase domain-containing protein [Granulicella sibirica]RXH55628.1 Type I restriction-modification system, specificity subunit S [Granulicella sibirica]